MDHEWTNVLFSDLFFSVFFLVSFLLSAFYVKHSHEDALLDKKLESEWEMKYMCELCQGAGKKPSSWGQSKLYETSILSQMIRKGALRDGFRTVPNDSVF